ncbi:hypothetical protein GPECTOR_43g898 [Gonium pectorale]|uniref:Uncharacterized protein n=1 Tax=Gonium pectorale TaxID=33097 RepID=A0A150G9E6_GONPE|nr:hypothetical protein GPECTOR_43g898 [Gonium pectorale]|eukprot:KXZ46462.1 hypothetical protein GPECTOR_43g898 [Gonium pectorale]
MSSLSLSIDKSKPDRRGVVSISIAPSPELLDEYPLVFPYPFAPPPGWVVHEGLLLPVDMGDDPVRMLEQLLQDNDVPAKDRAHFASTFLTQVAINYLRERGGVPDSVPPGARKAAER